jgi:hypothetical protein
VNRRHVVLVALLVLSVAVILRGERLFALGSSSAPQVAVAFDPSELTPNGGLHDAWESSLARQAIPHAWINEGDLAVLGSDRLAKRYPVVILPDGLTRWISDPLAGELIAYANHGGTLIVVADAGTHTDDNRVLADSVFGDLVDKNVAKGNLIYVSSSAGSLLLSGHPEVMSQTMQRVVAGVAAARRNELAVNTSK